jgi:6-phosphofructokinase
MEQNMMKKHETQAAIGILVGGGPAPGINSVIGAAAIQCIVGGRTVLGIRDGFRWIMEGDTTRVKPLSIDEVSRIHFRGGSHVGTARANPAKNPEHLGKTLETLLKLNVSGLITIGGDDTAFSALKLAQMAAGRLQIVHVPKTIDNDLDLPHGMSTFGFQTARHVGVDLLKNLMVDASTTSRWYVVVTMGRKAGHLALGIGKAAGATLTIIPEEFRGRPVRLSTLVDILTGAIVKRLGMGRSDGVAVLAEGLAESLDSHDVSGLEGCLETRMDICAWRRSISAKCSSGKSKGSWPRSALPVPWWQKILDTNCGAPIRFHTTWSTLAISAIAPLSFSWTVATRRWCPFKTGVLFRFPSTGCWILRPVGPVSEWWTSTRSLTGSHAGS